MRRGTGLVLLFVLLVAACTPAPEAAPPTRTQAPTLAPSPTVNPVVPTFDPERGAGVNSATAAAVASSGDVETPVAVIGEAAFEVEASADGLRLQGTLYQAAEADAPAVLLLHALGRTRSDWDGLVVPMQQAGYTVLAMDLRGHGASRGGQDWEFAMQDVSDMLLALRLVDGVDPGRVGVVGASIGANLSLVGCAANASCRTVVLLSPGLDYRGVRTDVAVERLGERPLLIVASEEDTYAAESSQTLDTMALGQHDLVMLNGAGHGTTMLQRDQGLLNTILAWLTAHL